MNYNNGKIYKITADETDKLYIGSSCKPYLSRRLQEHKGDYKKWLNGSRPDRLTSFEILQYENPQITLIESYPCNNKDELRARERYWIEHDDFKNICVNKNIPGRTKKESNKQWREKNSDYLKEVKKQYRENNKEQISEQNKKWREVNKELISEQKKQTMECECGSTHRISDKQRHMRTKKHINFMENK